MDTRTPKFCGVCGSPLEARGTRKGFDPFTGEPEVDTTLVCSNPDRVVTSRVLSNKVNTQYTFHPTWTNNGGTWAQV